MTKPKPSPISEASAKVVQAQLDGYNARDIAAWLATYSEDAEQFMLHAGSPAKGGLRYESEWRNDFEIRLYTRSCFTAPVWRMSLLITRWSLERSQMASQPWR
jgi:hypothetical protein